MRARHGGRKRKQRKGGHESSRATTACTWGMASSCVWARETNRSEGFGWDNVRGHCRARVSRGGLSKTVLCKRGSLAAQAAAMGAGGAAPFSSTAAWAGEQRNRTRSGVRATALPQPAAVAAAAAAQVKQRSGRGSGAATVDAIEPWQACGTPRRRPNGQQQISQKCQLGSPGSLRSMRLISSAPPDSGRVVASCGGN